MSPSLIQMCILLSRGRPRFLPAFLLAFGAASLLHAQVDTDINEQVWKQKFGILDAQMDEQAPYTAWLSQDADGDGVNNRAEFIAGTNPFKKLPSEPHFRPPSVITEPTQLSLSFPTVAGKYYAVESNETLMEAWNRGSLPGLTGDGTSKTLVVPKNAGKFFRILVTDQATQGDQVSDWAKHMLGFSPSAPITSQSSYDQQSLSAELGAQNEVTFSAVDTYATQPTAPSSPASDLGVLRISRSGFMLLGEVTVPITKSGSAVEGTDYATLPTAVTFPPGVKSLDIRITPLHNPDRTSSITVFLSADEPDSPGASGSYSLGTPAFAGLTIHPAANPTGTGLTGNFYPGSSSTYSSPLNFSDLASTSYSYTKSTTTTGTAVVTYSGTPSPPIAAGSTVSLQFISGNLNTSAYNTLKDYTVTEPVTANSFTVGITGTNVPSTGTGNSNLGGFMQPLSRLAPTLDFTWGHGSPNGNNYVGSDHYSVTWDGFLAPTVPGNYVFRLDANDKARLLIDTGSGFQQILENGWDTPATNGYKMSTPVALGVPAAAANRYPIRLEFVETTGSAKCRFQWQVNGGSFITIPSTEVFTTNTGTTAGWTGVYYNNSTFTPPAARTQTDTDPTAGNSGDWLTGSVDPLLHHNNFSCRWTGQILPQYSQTYYFVAKANDGFKLWINRELILDHWTGANGLDRTASIDLQANVLYDITMESYESTSTSEAHLWWYSQDQAKQIVPTNRLFPYPTGSPAITSPTEVVTLMGTGSPFTMNVTASNGGTVTASGLPPWLSLSNGILSGTPPAAGIYQFELIATNGAGTGSSVLTLEVQETEGLLTRELWTSGVSGPALHDVPWHLPPSSSDTVTSVEDNATSYGANTGERLRGYFTAPVTGNYYFWIAANNAAELWISNDAEAVNKVLRATVAGPSGSPPATWNHQPQQKSQWLSLVAGRRYYIEALHNTGPGGSENHLSVAWFVDPTGTSINPVANGSPAASPTVGGIIPGYVLSPWDNPPTTTIPGTIYVTNLQGVAGLSGITATGGAFLRVTGNTAVLQLNHSGLTSGITSRRIRNRAGDVLFDVGTQEKNYPTLRTSDGGYTWNMQSSDLAALNDGEVSLEIATVNHPGGEVSGTFGRTAGSQTAPPTPAMPSWTDLHASSDAANSRFLTQATFGPSPADMDSVKTNGYRPWIENQFTLPATKNIPYVLANLSNDPQNAYGSNLMVNSWWRNSITAPDQLRQRMAFALSEILVVSNTGPLNNNGRVLADYYDNLLDYSFGNYREILKQVTLSPAMGVYLDMRANALGNIQTGLHPNENYAREILQLFSTGLYGVWPDGTLKLDSNGNPVPTYDQSVVTGYARVFTGWNWGQKLVDGRLPTGFNPASNYLDPMVLVPAKHELGTKVLLDNVVLPAATVVNQSDASTDPASTYTVQTTDPDLGPGNLVTTIITNRFDLNGVKDLEAALDNIMANPATGPYICRQLIQRLVTSHPKPEYVHRVVRAFNGERNIDGVRTGVRGDMKEIVRAILLDFEARDPGAAADVKFGKQREPVLRITAPARNFPAATIPNSTYRQIGYQSILITTPIPHRLVNDERISLSKPVDSEGSTSILPTAQSYTVANSTPSYSLSGATGIATITSPGYQAGDTVALQFTSGTLGSTAPYNTVRNYVVQSATPANFTINIGNTSFVGTPTGNSFTPNNFTVANSSITAPNYTSVGNTVTIASSNFIAGHQVYLKFSTGGLAGGAFDGIHTIATAGGSFTVTLPSSPPNTSGTALIPRLSGGYNVTNSGGVSTILIQHSGNHNLVAGEQVQIHFRLLNTGTPAQSGIYTVTSINGPTSFRVTSPGPISSGSQGSTGMYAYPLKASQWTCSGTAEVDPSTWSVGSTDNTLNQTPLDSTTVFNFFYPDYQYPGEIARAGLTTPEFQLTNDSNTMVLTNAITQGTVTNNGANSKGYVAFFGSNAVTMDLAPYLTAEQTADAAIPELVDTLGVLMTGGNLSAASRTTISDFVANQSNFPYTAPSATEIRNRVRAIVHLIATSAEYAIQK